MNCKSTVYLLSEPEYKALILQNIAHFRRFYSPGERFRKTFSERGSRESRRGLFPAASRFSASLFLFLQLYCRPAGKYKTGGFFAKTRCASMDNRNLITTKPEVKKIPPLVRDNAWIRRWSWITPASLCGRKISKTTITDPDASCGGSGIFWN